MDLPSDESLRRDEIVLIYMYIVVQVHVSAWTYLTPLGWTPPYSEHFLGPVTVHYTEVSLYLYLVELIIRTIIFYITRI